jgi:hypothetical protein
LAQFVASGKTVYSGGAGWEVYATGMDRDPGAGAPSVAQVNAEIAKANAGAGGAGSSRGWVGPNGGPTNSSYVGTLAVGETNASAGGSFPQVCPASTNPNATNALNDAATWMWYNPSNLPNPFSGTVPGEYLIFRLPYSEVATPRRVTVNKDIANTTGELATGVSILIAGHHSQFAQIYYGSTTSFTSTFVGPNTLLQWTGAVIPPGSIVHVGFVLLETSVDLLGVYMTANGVNIGCGHQCNSNLHIWGFGGDLTYTNSVTACESVPLYVRNLSVQYFDGEQYLATLNPQSEPHPLHVDRIDIPPVRIDPGESAKVAIPSPPRGSNWAVLRYTVSAGPTEAGTEDFVQVPVPPRPIASGSCASSTTALCLNQGRFKVEVQWQVPPNATGSGQAVQLTGDTGYFWFFGPENVELMVKVLDGTPINQHYWVFYGALSDVQYRIVVTDTLRGTQRTYVNPRGTLASSADTSAFPQ